MLIKIVNFIEDPLDMFRDTLHFVLCHFKNGYDEISETSIILAQP